MKYLKNIILAVSLLLLAVSCQLNPERTKLYGEEDVVLPVLQSPGDIIINKDNVKNESVVLNWKEADFGASTQIEYTVFLKTGEEGEGVRLGSSFENSLVMSKEDFNGVAIAAGASVNKMTSISAYIVAKVFGTGVKEVMSEAVTFNVFAYEAPLRWLFMPGRYQGWSIENAPQFWETEGASNKYSTLVDMSIDMSNADAQKEAPNSFFKITNARNWSDGNWGYNDIKPDWVCPDNNDGNISVNLDESSIYIFTVDMSAMTISKEKVSKVTVIGDFDECKWAEDKELDMKYDPATNIWSSPEVTFSTGSEFLFRLNGEWSQKYGEGNKDSKYVEGGRELLKGGANLKVPESGKYIMRLHANRTPFVVVMEKQ